MSSYFCNEKFQFLNELANLVDGETVSKSQWKLMALVHWFLPRSLGWRQICFCNHVDRSFPSGIKMSDHYIVFMQFVYL